MTYYRKQKLTAPSAFILQEQLIRKLAVILDVQDEDIIVEHLKEAGVGHRYTSSLPQDTLL